MRWRKVLSPLGLPGRAVICTRANRRSVRGAALSLQAAVLRLLQHSLFLLTLHHLSPSFLSIWLCLASSLRCLYSACLDCSFLFVCLQEVFPFDCQTKCTDSWWNSTSLQKKRLINFSLVLWIASQMSFRRGFSAALNVQNLHLPPHLCFLVLIAQKLLPPPPSWRIFQSLKCTLMRWGVRREDFSWSLQRGSTGASQLRSARILEKDSRKRRGCWKQRLQDVYLPN